MTYTTIGLAIVCIITRLRLHRAERQLDQLTARVNSLKSQADCIAENCLRRSGL